MNFQIGPFNIDLVWVITFFSGVFFGFIIMALWYFVAVLSSLNKTIKRKDVQEKDIDQMEIHWLIDDAKNRFKDKEKLQKVGFGKYLLDTSLELSNDIATKFYPKSKYPYLELTLDESLLLLTYVSKRFDELLSKPILAMFKGLTLRRLVTLNDTKEKIDKNLIVKTTNKFKIKEIFKNSMLALNVINPVYWFRRLILDNVTNAVMIKLGLVVISLVGEETYKIYSKKVFDKEATIDSGINEIYDDVVKDLKEDSSYEESK